MTAGADSDGASAFAPHDHTVCVAGALARAEKICIERKARLTPVRRRVLELLWESHRPMGAYALLDRLREEGLGSQPPTVYRALEFLMTYSLAHKVMKFNAFVGCAHPEEAHSPYFLICTECQRIDEMKSERLSLELGRALRGERFSPTQSALEVEGLCAACADPEGS